MLPSTGKHLALSADVLPVCSHPCRVIISLSLSITMSMWDSNPGRLVLGLGGVGVVENLFENSFCCETRNQVCVEKTYLDFFSTRCSFKFFYFVPFIFCLFHRNVFHFYFLPSHENKTCAIFLFYFIKML